MAVISKRNREFIYNRDKVCLRCGSERNKTIDHVIPLSRGGRNHVSNYQLLCRKCNELKGATTIDFRNGISAESDFPKKETKPKPKVLKHIFGAMFINENIPFLLKPNKSFMYIGMFGIESNLKNFHTSN